MKPIHALFGCLMLGCNATLNSPQQIETVTIDEARWALAWSDEFDGENGMPPNPMNWTYETGGHGFGNNQLEFNTNSPDNAMLDGEGHLVITARRQQYLGKPSLPRDSTQRVNLNRPMGDTSLEPRCRAALVYGQHSGSWVLTMKPTLACMRRN